MKQNISILLAVGLLMGIIPGCKKSDSASPKNYAASITDKSWSGAITYTSKTTQYYSVHFNADNTLIWIQLSGEYSGHWALDGKTITMTFDANTAKIIADISEDNELINITDNTGAYEINSGVLIVNPNISLENTVWQGTEINTITALTKAIQMNFKSGGLVELKSGNTVIGTYSYSRKAAGAAIYIPGGYFGVLMSGGEMKGSDGNAAFPWQTIRQ